MSQLNNEKSNVAKNSAKKTFFMLLVFAVICAGVTVALIYNTLSLKKQNTATIDNNVISENEIGKENKEENKSNISTVKKVKLTDKYINNGIKEESKHISLGDIIYQNEMNEERKLEIHYLQISGLKNKTIQEKINKEIENNVLELRNDEEINDPEIRNINISGGIVGNFSDVLSVLITKTIVKMDINESYSYEEEYRVLNYSLKDGKEINFNDLFTEDAAIKNIITQSVYSDLAMDYAYSSDSLDADMDKIDYSDMEDKVFKILVKYKQNPNLKFYFTPSTIGIIDGVELYTIKMVDFYESIAIYTRYKATENLYDTEVSEKNSNYVFSAANISNFIFDTNKKTDNFYYEILNYPEKEKSEDFKKAEKIIQEKIYEQINEYAILANKNKDRGYMYSVLFYVSDYQGKISYNYYGTLCSADRKFYDENLEEILATSRREERPDMGNFDYSWVDKDNIDFEEEISVSVDDYKNPVENKNITTREDREKMEAEYQ